MDNRKKENRHWLGRRPGYQGPRPISGSQGMVEKWNTGALPESEILRLNGALRATENNKIQENSKNWDLECEKSNRSGETRPSRTRTGKM